VEDVAGLATAQRAEKLWRNIQMGEKEMNWDGQEDKPEAILENGHVRRVADVCCWRVISSMESRIAEVNLFLSLSFSLTLSLSLSLSLLSLSPSL
jgi:hypothetical protein